MSIEKAQQLHSEGLFDEARVIYEYEIECLEDILNQITTWHRDYPRGSFVEPTKEQWQEAHLVLNKAKGCSLAAVSASRVRFVLNGLGKIIDKERQSKIDQAE